MSPEEELIEKISNVLNKTKEEVLEEAQKKSDELNGMITVKGALTMMGKESGAVELNEKVENSADVKRVEKIKENMGTEDIEIDPIITSPISGSSSFGKEYGEELTLDDLSKKFIKAPSIGEEVEFVLKKIFKSDDIEAIGKDGKKFSTALSNVDYKMVYLTKNSEEFAPKSWEVVGKTNAICRKLKKIENVEIKVKHILDGRIEKDKDCYEVSTKVDGIYKQLNRKTQDWE